MRKYLSILIMIAIALFIGIKGASALAINGDLTFEEDKTKSSTDAAAGIKKTVINVMFTAKETTTLSGSDTWEIKYNKPHDKSDVSLYDEGEIAVSTSFTKESGKGATLAVNYSGNVEKGKKYRLFTLEFTSDSKYTGEDCGGKITPKASGSSNTNSDDQTVDDENTGVSVPVAIIGIGAITGLAVYSLASNKTKMHRI